MAGAVGGTRVFLHPSKRRNHGAASRSRTVTEKALQRSAVALCGLLCVTSSCSRRTQSDKRAAEGPSKVLPASVSVATNRDLLEINYGWSDNAREGDAVAEAVRAMNETSVGKQ